MEQLIGLKIAEPGIPRGSGVPHSKFGSGPECSLWQAPYMGGFSALWQQHRAAESGVWSWRGLSLAEQPGQSRPSPSLDPYFSSALAA